MIRIETAKTITNSCYVGKIIHNKPFLIFPTSSSLSIREVSLWLISNIITG